MENLLKALQAVMEDAAYVQKNGRNAFHNYKYATEADLVAVVRPAMIKHGLLLIGPSVEGEPRLDEHGNTTVTLLYTLAHVSGEVWPEKLRIVGCGNDRAKNGTVGDKGVYKAYTGAVKYLLFKLLLIETGDDPEVASAHDTTSETPQAAAPTARPANGNGAARSGLGADAPSPAGQQDLLKAQLTRVYGPDVANAEEEAHFEAMASIERATGKSDLAALTVAEGAKLLETLRRLDPYKEAVNG